MRWAPTSYTWSYNSYKQGYNPSSVYRVYSLVGAHLVGGV